MKKETPTQMFPLNFSKILRRRFLENISYVTAYDSTELDGKFFSTKVLASYNSILLSLPASCISEC